MAAKAAEISEVICGLAARAQKPVCASWPSPPRAVPALLAERGVYSFVDPGRGIRALVQAGRARRFGAPTRTAGIASEQGVRLAGVDASVAPLPPLTLRVFPRGAAASMGRPGGRGDDARDHSGARLPSDSRRCGARRRRRRTGSRMKRLPCGLPMRSDCRSCSRASRRGSPIGPRRVSLRSTCARKPTCAPHSVASRRARRSSGAARRCLRAEAASARHGAPRHRLSRSDVRRDGELRQRRRVHRAHRRRGHRARTGRVPSSLRICSSDCARGAMRRIPMGLLPNRSGRAVHRALRRARANGPVGAFRIRSKSGTVASR